MEMIKSDMHEIVKVHWARIKLGMGGSEEGEDEGYEIAEEVRPAESLSLSADLVRRHAVASEFAIVCRTKMDGIYIIPSYNNSFEWFGVLFIRRGVFQGAILRFSLFVPSDFPDTSTIPVIRFDNDVFHPLVDMKTKTVDMRRFFPDGWKKEKHHIVNALLVLQRIFFSLDLDVESCANAEAAILWKDDKSKFRQLARQCVDTSRGLVYEDSKNADDPNCIRFLPWCETEHRETRNKMLSGSDEGVRLPSLLSSSSSSVTSRSSSMGYSWIDTDALTYMTEPAQFKMDEDSTRAHSDRLIHGIEKLDLSAVIDEQENVQMGGMSSPGGEAMREGETTDEEVGESHI